MKEYDFTLNWSIKTEEVFIKVLKEVCQKMNLSFFWISDENVREVIKGVETNQIKIKFLLDTEATYNREKDLYARVCYAIKDAGGIIIDDPDRARIAVDKSAAHYELMNAGINVPYTVVVRNWEPKTFKLSEEEKEKLGSPFIIKPASGYAWRGVVEATHGSINEIAKARKFDANDNFLLQEKIKPVKLGDKRAWFRIFHVFDKLIPCWWDDHTRWYEHITEEDFQKYHFSPLVKIASEIAKITRMAWFSTEIGIDNKLGHHRFVVIDYINDQCDMTVKSQDKTGVPDHIVKYTASSIAESAYKLINNREISKEYTVWLSDNKSLQVRGLGDATESLR